MGVQKNIKKLQEQNEILGGALTRALKELDAFNRPMHCTDLKRETLYIKDDDVWQKDANKQKIKKAIKNISTKQFSALNNWTKENPDFQNDETKQNYYTKIGFKDFTSDNSVCLINKQGKPIATRIFGLIPRSLKKHKWIKISSLSTGFF